MFNLDLEILGHLIAYESASKARFPARQTLVTELLTKFEALHKRPEAIEALRLLGMDTAGINFENRRQRSTRLWQTNFATALVNAHANPGRLLLVAALSEDVDLMKSCLEAGARALARGIKGITALHLAASNGRMDLMRLLLEAKANVLATDSRGISVMALAALSGHSEVVELLYPMFFGLNDSDAVAFASLTAGLDTRSLYDPGWLSRYERIWDDDKNIADIVDLLPSQYRRQGEDSTWFTIFNDKEARKLNIAIIHTLVLSEDSGDIYCVRFSADGLYIASVCNGNVHIFEAESGAKITTLSRTPIPIICLCFSPDGLFLLTGDRDRCVTKWDTSKRTIEWQVKNPEGPVYSLVTARDLLATASTEGNIRLWDIKSGRNTLTLHTVNWSLGELDFAFSPNVALIGAGFDSHLCIWDTIGGRLLEVSQVPFLGNVMFSSTGNEIFYAGEEEIKCFEVLSEPGFPTPRSKPSLLSVKEKWSRRLIKKTQCLKIGDGEWIASLTANGTVEFWDVHTGSMGDNAATLLSGIQECDFDMTMLANI
jgi:WD40 repeat protein